jgi:hypothetical protein
MKNPRRKPAANGDFHRGSDFLSDAEFHRLCEEGRARRRRMTVSQTRAWLIRIGALTPEGKVTVYPMDHVPLGPKN